MRAKISTCQVVAKQDMRAMSKLLLLAWHGRQGMPGTTCTALLAYIPELYRSHQITLFTPSTCPRMSCVDETSLQNCETRRSAVEHPLYTEAFLHIVLRTQSLAQIKDSPALTKSVLVHEAGINCRVGVGYSLLQGEDNMLQVVQLGAHFC